MNHLRSHKDIGKTKGARSRTHGGDRKARPIKTRRSPQQVSAHERRRGNRAAEMRGRVGSNPGPRLWYHVRRDRIGVIDGLFLLH